jgi:hypothetical protein
VCSKLGDIVLSLHMAHILLAALKLVCSPHYETGSETGDMDLSSSLRI